MRYCTDWQDYELLDASGGERLERWGEFTLIRPDPQIMWGGQITANADARYIRNSSYKANSKHGTHGKEGEWLYSNPNKPLPKNWNVRYKGLTFKVKPTWFKHTGVFPEQAVNWDYCRQLISDEIKASRREINVLNMFAYTGGATLACLKAGAKVCHLDAVKSIVEWGKENANLSKLNDKPVRWIIDDAMKFLGREIKRGNKYDAIILDPPSYGRGTNGETWKLEDCINSLLLMCSEVLSDNPLFLLMNSYTTGLSPSAVSYLMKMTLGDKRKVQIESSEIGLPVKSTGLILPCGNTAIARF
ncbi:MAG: class I SAM-dependent methyltransferase [Oscillospiraceae bacterium]|nr:class I SAM-dependent methyltransferase [Oscillospiraceae bacterium]